MLQQERPDDYVLASGVAHTVADLARTAFACVDLDAERYVRTDEKLLRSAETPEQHAERGRSHEGARAARLEARVGFEELVERMVDADMRSLAGVRRALLSRLVRTRAGWLVQLSALHCRPDDAPSASSGWATSACRWRWRSRRRAAR